VAGAISGAIHDKEGDDGAPQSCAARLTNPRCAGKYAEPEDGLEPMTYRLQGTRPPRRSTRRIPVPMRNRTPRRPQRVGTGFVVNSRDPRGIGHRRLLGARSRLQRGKAPQINHSPGCGPGGRGSRLVGGGARIAPVTRAARVVGRGWSRDRAQWPGLGSSSRSRGRRRCTGRGSGCIAGGRGRRTCHHGQGSAGLGGGGGGWSRTSTAWRSGRMAGVSG
jgi:hypothetical protein